MSDWARTFPIPLGGSYSISQLIQLIPEGRPQLSPVDRGISVSFFSALDDASDGCISFCSAQVDKAPLLIAESSASVVVVRRPVSAIKNRNLILVDDPMLWFASMLRKLVPIDEVTAEQPNIHPSVSIGRDVRIGRNVFIGENVVLGSGSCIGHGAVILRNSKIGVRCNIGENSVIGAAGIAVSWNADNDPIRFPHHGSVLIGDDISIGAHACIVRGMLSDTVIGSKTQIGNHVNIGHNVTIGQRCWISTRVVICGSVKMDEGVSVGAGSVINNHVSLGPDSSVGLGSVVTKLVDAGCSVFGNPAKRIRGLKVAVRV